MIDFSQFQNKYFRIEKGASHDLVLSRWRVEESKFGTDQESKRLLAFDVLKADGLEYASKPLSWGTTSFSLIMELKPLIERAEREDKIVIHVRIKRDSDGKYATLDLSRPSY